MIGTPAQPLVAGLAPTAAVTPPGNVITPDAVNSLVNSFHNGVITGDDLAAHSGMMAYLRNKDEGQKIRENTSQSAIDARESQRQATIAQNNLVTQTAAAQAGLVQPTADLAATKTALDQAQTQMGPTGISAIQQNGWMFGKTMDDFRKPDGGTDFVAAAKEGNQMAGQLSLANAWLERLQPTGEPMKTTDAAGGEHTHYLNSRKEDVTPPLPNQGYPGSPMYWQIVKELNNYLPDYHPMRSKLMMTKSSSGEVNSLRPGPIVDGAPTSLVGPKAPQNQETPVVTPDAPALAPASDGVSTKAPVGAYQTPADIRKDLVSDPIVKTLLEQQKYAINFKTIADNQEKQGATLPGQKVPAQNANDIGLAESIVKLYDPQAAIREFKWSKLEEAQPWLEKIGAWKQLALHEGSFTPESRQRLIKMGDEIIGGMETAARGRLSIANSAAMNSASIAGQNPQAWSGQTLTEDEQRILRREPFRTPQAPQSPSQVPAPNSGVVILKTGPYAGWKYDPRTGTVSQ